MFSLHSNGFLWQITEDKVRSMVEREELFEGLKRQEAVFNEVNTNIKKSQDKVRKRKLDHGQVDHFKVGDLVLKRNKRLEQRKGGKLEPDILGPYRIVTIEGKIADIGAEKGEKTMQINIDHLSHYVTPEERMPAKIKKVFGSVSSGWSTDIHLSVGLVKT